MLKQTQLKQTSISFLGAPERLSYGVGFCSLLKAACIVGLLSHHLLPFISLYFYLHIHRKKKKLQ